MKLAKFLRNLFLQNTLVAAFVNWNLEKSTSLNSKGPNSITKTGKHCAKYVQSKTKNKFCKTKCVKLNFYKCVHFLLLWLLSTLWIYHFYCFPISFLLLYLSFHLDSLHRHPDFPHFSHCHPDFRPRF